MTNQDSIHEEIKCVIKAENLCYYSVQILLSSCILSKNLKIKIYKIILPVVLYGYEAWSLTLRETKTKGIWKPDPEVNIWGQEGWEWGVEKTPQRGT